MRFVAVLILTICQFTAFPFLAIVAANTARQEEERVDMSSAYQANAINVTTIYKSHL